MRRWCVPLLAAGAAPRCAAAGCATCKGPVHSWATFPVSFHGSELSSDAAGGFPAAELDVVRRFPLVTIEKWQGVNAKNASGGKVFLWGVDAAAGAARQIKAANPKASVVIWLDTELIYTGWTWPGGGPINQTLNPDVKGNCATGHFRPAEFLETHQDYLLKNTSGLPAVENWSGCHIYDHTQAKVRDYWRDEVCLKATATGVIDGCGADFSNHNCGGAGVDAATCTAWAAGHKQMMRDTSAALGDGILIGKSVDELGDHVSAVLTEGCSAENSTITMLQGLARRAKTLGRRLVYQCHTFGYCVTGCKNGILDSAAAFLIGAGDDHYFTTGGWRGVGGDNGTLATHWFPELFDRPLGAPVADAAYDTATSTWSRSFKSGTRVTFDAAAKKGSIAWADSNLVGI